MLVKGCLGGSECIMGTSIICNGKNSIGLQPTWVTTRPCEWTEFVNQVHRASVLLASCFLSSCFLWESKRLLIFTVWPLSFPSSCAPKQFSSQSQRRDPLTGNELVAPNSVMKAFQNTHCFQADYHFCHSFSHAIHSGKINSLKIKTILGWDHIVVPLYELGNRGPMRSSDSPRTLHR